MYARIFVPVDSSPTSSAGLREAVRLARLTGGHLRLLHVVKGNARASEVIAYADEPELVTEGVRKGSALLARLHDEIAKEGIQVGTVLIEGSGQSTPAFITDQAAAWHADLIVIGTHGRRGVDRFVQGSVAEQILRHATMPVLAVRCPDEATPSATGLQSIAGAIA